MIGQLRSNDTLRISGIQVTNDKARIDKVKRDG